MNNTLYPSVPDEILQFDFNHRIFTFKSNTAGVEELIDEIIDTVGIDKLPEITEQVLNSYHQWKQRNYDIDLGELLSYLEKLKTKKSQKQDFDNFLYSKSATDFESTEDVIAFIKEAALRFGLPLFNQLEKYIHEQYALWYKRSDVIDLTKIDSVLEIVKKSLRNKASLATPVYSNLNTNETNFVEQSDNEADYIDIDTKAVNSRNRKNRWLPFIIIISVVIVIIAFVAIVSLTSGSNSSATITCKEWNAMTSSQQRMVSSHHVFMNDSLGTVDADQQDGPGSYDAEGAISSWIINDICAISSNSGKNIKNAVNEYNPPASEGVNWYAWVD
jgi:hypothetical protein